jgi:hypothetical protein
VTIEHPFGTIKARKGATHFSMKTLPQHHGRPAAPGGDESTVIIVFSVCGRKAGRRRRKPIGDGSKRRRSLTSEK